MATGTPMITIESRLATMDTNQCLLQLADEDDRESMLQATQTSENVTGIHSVIDITCYSTIDKLVVVTPYICRFAHNAYKQQP